ncbi:MAG TPA: class I SAM-dependent methyltransferase, partial [Bacteroidales bacterium]|nr:class I SAM-dependent methyltransferase [Bacteroidales bacterium]
LKEHVGGVEGVPIIIRSDSVEYEPMSPGYFFRSMKEMPLLEREALQMCRGKVLDVGFAAGAHALELLGRGLDVYGVDVSPGAVSVAIARGFTQVRQIDFNRLEGEHFDTILLMMNGVGMCGTLKKLPGFLRRCQSLLTSDGQILLDSADLQHLFMEEDGSLMVNLGVRYYGEVRYQMQYRNIVGRPFEWLYVDFYSLSRIAAKVGLRAELIASQEDHSYLARLTKLQ